MKAKLSFFALFPRFKSLHNGATCTRKVNLQIQSNFEAIYDSFSSREFEETKYIKKNLFPTQKKNFQEVEKSF